MLLQPHTYCITATIVTQSLHHKQCQISVFRLNNIHIHLDHCINPSNPNICAVTVSETCSCTVTLESATNKSASGLVYIWM